MIPELHEFSETLAELGRFTGIRFTWHFPDNTLLQSVCPEQTEHKAPFCVHLRQENSAGNLRKCIAEHHEMEFRTALRERKPFVIRCHAGASELIVPLLVGGEFLGNLCAGTFFDPAFSGLSEREEERRKLPAVSEEKLAELGRLLTRMADHSLGSMILPRQGTPLLKQLLTRDLRIIQAVLFLRKNHRKNLTAEQAARAAHLCTSHFLHLFPRETGYTYSDFLQRLRVEDALKLVEGTDLPLSEIAEMSGIRYQSRMGVLFRRYLHVSPRTLRKNPIHH